MPFKATGLRNQTAVTAALDYLLTENPACFVCGQDIGRYGSAFKTTKGLLDKFGQKRIIDLPICESGSVGFCLGASQTGGRPIMEFQFADFATEAVTQLGFNCGTWFFRSERPAQLLFRMPCGGGVNLGAFHSGEFDGLWSISGLKLFYPVNPQETFEALVAGFYDPNPCIVFEHKFIYYGKPADVDFDGDVEKIFRPRKYSDGNDLTIIATGAMVDAVMEVTGKNGYSADVWNPFILFPLETSAIAKSVRKTGRLLVVQESGETAGLGSAIVYRIVKECFGALKCAPILVSAPDVPLPFAKELELQVIPGREKIDNAIKSMIGANA